MAKYIDLQYEAPAVVQVSFTVKADEWNALDDLAKAEYVKNELINANNNLAEGDGTSTYITNTTVDVSKVEAEDGEYEYEEGEYE
jgi:hypothetical protein